VLAGIYYDLQKENGIAHGTLDISTMLNFAVDDCSLLSSSGFFPYYTNDINFNYWSGFYGFVYRVNSAIEQLKASGSVSEEVKNRMLGECSFIRAFCYFYLVNLYGDVPLLTSSDPQNNSLAKRNPESEVYDQIIEDLQLAKELLPSNYVMSDLLTSTPERVRPNKWAAISLLSRVYLYMNKYPDALEEASMIIENKSLFETTGHDSVFLKNSKEAIWQLQPKSDDGLFLNTVYPRFYVFLDDQQDPDHPVSASASLLAAFEPNDLRRSKWLVDSHGYLTNDASYFSKYKYYGVNESAQEYIMVFRLAEQYLIRAECRLLLGDVNGALEDLNVIRNRSNLAPLESDVVELIQTAILNERRVELFTEWGHRWFDLKRLNKLDEVMSEASVIKNSVWKSTKKLFAIPVEDLRLNKNLRQNEGYPSL
jgi:hypothetical protein